MAHIKTRKSSSSMSLNAISVVSLELSRCFNKMIERRDEKKIVSVLGTHRNFIRTDQIARLSRLPLFLTRKILDQLERDRYVICSPLKKLKHPVKLIKEQLQRGRHPSGIYEVVDKEYRLTQRM